MHRPVGNPQGATPATRCRSCSSRACSRCAVGIESLSTLRRANPARTGACGRSQASASDFKLDPGAAVAAHDVGEMPRA